MPIIDLSFWEPRFAAYLDTHTASDVAHSGDHVQRVVTNARTLAEASGANLDIVIPAAWLHDCVVLPKDSPQRPLASTMAATAASAFLAMSGFPPLLIPAVAHAIAAHSFSANITPLTLEARVVRDADRLDALGAVGIARCLMLGAQLGRPLYDQDEPFPVQRPADDTIASIDHFYTKLLGLAETMATDAGRAEAERRSAFMRTFLRQLGHEIGRPAPE
ncbi:MAG: HD domain-containing protein [Oscillochloris sp.]|nr:HD domain-containing protein [Oscillochloris sp.]